MRVALATNFVPPYRVPVLRALAATPGWSLRVFVSAASEFDRDWRVDAPDLDVVRVPGRARRRPVRIGDQRLELTQHLPLGLPRALARFDPDVVISGELGARTLLAWSWCAPRGTPLVVWSYPSRAAAAGIGALRRGVWRFLATRADAVVGMGEQARGVLRGLGVAEERLFDARNAHDRDAWRAARAGLDRRRCRRALREEFGARGRVALVPGRLLAWKGVDALLATWRALPEKRRAEWTLLFVGSGPLEGRVRAASAAAAPGEIAHAPAVAPPALARFYAGAELLVFPSLADPWGLVVNEALEFGLPVLCSRLAGSSELIRPGANGWLFDPRDPEDFAARLEQALAQRELAPLRRAARRTAAALGPETMARGLREAADYAVSRTRA